ncbi:hypothetical protein QJS04_geneDACA021415 [Acorus gramineus]|uniref:Uncharacterized protein n=1 Tax=Acorus gramineus TaxID=55184 RepID=A0AAV9A7A2_ACOGR|nr:hypothetical protein QJS04_geneDACA021415 [Acorus gramineus]
MVEYLPPEISDHSPMKVISASSYPTGPRPFKYFESWETHPSFSANVEAAWETPTIDIANFTGIKSILSRPIPLKTTATVTISGSPPLPSTNNPHLPSKKPKTLTLDPHLPSTPSSTPRRLVLESHPVVDLKSRYCFFGADARVLGGRILWYINRDTPRILGRNGFCQYKDIKMERKTRKA